MWKQNTRKKNVYNDNYEQKAAKKKSNGKKLIVNPKNVYLCVFYINM